MQNIKIIAGGRVVYEKTITDRYAERIDDLEEYGRIIGATEIIIKTITNNNKTL